jgi:iron-sulfur cluster repair protein YtfE (RIC family)
MDKITKNIPIEELISKYPRSVNYLMKKGIKCIVCGEPIWGTLEDAAKERGFDDQDVSKILQELNEQIEN